MYAITPNGYRAITAEMGLDPGETKASEIPAALLTHGKAEQMKADRRQLLRATDWTQMPDAPITSAEKVAYQAYRQALRDLPSLPGFPNVAWPVPPALSDGAASGAEIPVSP